MPDQRRAIDPSPRACAPPTTLACLPLMLTVSEAAAVLRVSRTSAYKLAEAWRATHGAAGLPTVRLGSRVLVRRVDLAAIVGLDYVGLVREAPRDAEMKGVVPSMREAAQR